MKSKDLGNNLVCLKKKIKRGRLSMKDKLNSLKLKFKIKHPIVMICCLQLQD